MVGGKKMVEVDKVDSTLNTDTSDIDFLTELLLSGLGIPKTFLNYGESAGEGKNLSVLDVRLSRMVESMQVSFIAELNKMAKVHLFLRGYHEAIDDFRLSLNIPSVQSALLQIEEQKARIELFHEAIKIDEATGFAAMSVHQAKTEILGFTPEQVVADIRGQFMEKAIMQELKEQLPNINSLDFVTDLVKKYNDPTKKIVSDSEEDSNSGSSDGGSDRISNSLFS
jgi:hypothetical protein